MMRPAVVLFKRMAGSPPSAPLAAPAISFSADASVTGRTTKLSVSPEALYLATQVGVPVIVLAYKEILVSDTPTSGVFTLPVHPPK